MLTLCLSSALLLATPPTVDDPAQLAWQGMYDRYSGAESLDFDVRFQMEGDDTSYRGEMKLAKGLKGTVLMTRGDERIPFVGNGRGFYVLSRAQETYTKLPGGYLDLPVVSHLAALQAWAGDGARTPTSLRLIESKPANPLMRVIQAEFPDHKETLWIGPDHGLLAATVDIAIGEVHIVGHLSFARAETPKGVDANEIAGVLPAGYSEVNNPQELLLPVGIEAPDVTLTGLDGREFQLDDLRGKTVLLNFWFYT